MRNPRRSESDAFYLALGGATLTGASIALGALVDPIAGGALFTGGLIGACVWELSTQDPDRRQPLREAAAARHELTTGAETQREALDEERALSGALASELAKAQREIETQAMQARKANGEAAQLKQTRSVTGVQSLDPGAREYGHPGTGGSGRASLEAAVFRVD